MLGIAEAKLKNKETRDSLLDEVFAQALLGKTSDNDLFNFCMYVMQKAREGHLCVSMDSVDEDLPLKESIKRGSTLWTEDISPIVKLGDFFLLQRNNFFEENIATHFTRLFSQEKKECDIDTSPLLNKEQRRAVLAALKEPLSLISGGPGTGKSFTIIQLLHAIYDNNRDASVVVAAPTGKATAHLRNQVPAKWKGRICASTLHALLNLRFPKDVYNLGQEIDADYVIVDECSMIDASMWASLLCAIKKGSHLVLIGDHNQLPPVEAGTVFETLCDFVQEKDPNRYTHLRECLRTDETGILTLSEAVRQGDLARVERGLKGVDYTELGRSLPAPLFERADTYFTLDATLGKKDVLKAFEQFRILSAFRAGSFGVDEINRRLRSRFFKPGLHYVPIIITRSSQSQELYNGEHGVLCCTGHQENFALFPSLTEPSYRKLSVALLPPFDYAYCLSVHKSQGSEYNSVVLILPEKSEVFGREVLYTGITRARKELAIISQKETIKMITQRVGRRLSTLPSRLREEI